MCRRLRAGADEVDRLLAAAGDVRRPGGPDGAPLQDQVAEVLAASSRISLAALRAAGDATGPRLAALVEDADRELRCLSAGVERAREAVPHPGN